MLQALASFHILSDLHINLNEERKNNLITAFKNMKELYPDTATALILAGDLTDKATEEQYKELYSILEEYDPVKKDNTLVLLGNHDVRGPNREIWEIAQDRISPFWQEAKERYLRYNQPYMEGAEHLYFSKVLNGYTFIVLNTERSLKDAAYITEEQLQFLKQTLKDCYEKEPLKPVFVLCHQPLNNTHWKSNILDGFDGLDNCVENGPAGKPQPYSTHMDQKVKEVLKKYPIAVYISGHAHNQFGQAEIQVRDFAICVDVPTFSCPEIGIQELGTGYEVLVFEDKIIFEARNFVTNTHLVEYDTVISFPFITQLIQTASDSLEKQNILDKMTRIYDQKGLIWKVLQPSPYRLFDSTTMQEIEEYRKTLLK